MPIHVTYPAGGAEAAARVWQPHKKCKPQAERGRRTTVEEDAPLVKRWRRRNIEKREATVCTSAVMLRAAVHTMWDDLRNLHLWRQSKHYQRFRSVSGDVICIGARSLHGCAQFASRQYERRHRKRSEIADSVLTSQRLIAKCDSCGVNYAPRVWTARDVKRGVRWCTTFSPFPRKVFPNPIGYSTS